MRVGDCIEVFGEAGGGHEIVDFAVGFEDFGDAGVYRGWVGDVAVVCCYFGRPV